jgi:hypothetical protein
MLTRPKVSSIVASQLPEFIRDDYQTFVEFLKAYYEFLETTQQDPVELRDLDTTLDSFITYFKSELATSLPYSTVDQRFLLGRIKDLYLAKGSEASFKLLFRILFNKSIEIDYPATQMLRASDGKWNQDVSVFVQVLVGHPQDIVGKLVDVVTQTKVIRVLVDRRQYVEVEVDRAIRVSDTLYELILDRRFFGTISVGDTLRYIDPLTQTLIFNGLILPTTSSLKIETPGSGFKVGDLYNINNFNGYGSIMKVSAVTPTGGIALGQFIKYGTGYTTDFTTTISSTSGQDLGGTAGTVIQRVDTFLAPANKTVNLTITESLNGFAESGSINTADYNLESDAEKAVDIATYGVVRGNFFDGAYAGITLREFGITNIDSQVTNTNPAIIKVGLGPLAKYPGYYVNNDGFLDDAIYIQDSKFYQAFSYVIKIDQALNSYKTIVKNLIHPAGTQIFGEYDIRNEFTINTTLESLIKILSLTLNDGVITDSGIDNNDLTRVNPNFTALSGTLLSNSTAGILKVFDETNLLNDTFTTDSQTVIMQEIGLTLDSARTMPYIVLNKPIDDTGNNILNDGATVDTFYVTPTDGGDNQTSTRTNPQFLATTGTLLSGSDAGFMKFLDSSHKLNDGTTIDTENVTPTDGGDDQTSARTNPALIAANGTLLTGSTAGFMKLLDGTHTINNGITVDTENAIADEPAYLNADGSSSRFGISTYAVTKTIDSTSFVHYLNDGSTADSDTFSASDTDASSSTDLNRTTPAFALTLRAWDSTNGSLTHVLNDGTTLDNDTTTTVDSGGILDFNPYVEAGYFLNDSGLYVGLPITFTG